MHYTLSSVHAHKNLNIAQGHAGFEAQCIRHFLQTSKLRRDEYYVHNEIHILSKCMSNNKNTIL